MIGESKLDRQLLYEAVMGLAVSIIAVIISEFLLWIVLIALLFAALLYLRPAYRKSLSQYGFSRMLVRRGLHLFVTVAFVIVLFFMVGPIAAVLAGIIFYVLFSGAVAGSLKGYLVERNYI